MEGIGGWRIIPALAGNTCSPSVSTLARVDHPRSRGEYASVGTGGPAPHGSSPLSRGILAMGVLRFLPRRIIPALAGNTVPRSDRASVIADHPRSRGEYPRATSAAAPSAGSSPLSRGIRCRDRAFWRAFRIIPALAGNTTLQRARTWTPGDHPRSRGEYGVAALPVARSWGSSPLSRGIPDACVYPPLAARIIPALAGNTSATMPVPRSRTDHPRSRGEYTRSEETIMMQPGSSPLSRGILGFDPAGPRRRGIIPALAGNTATGATAVMLGGDHPRSRGEYFIARSMTDSLRGSSPLSRGIRTAGAAVVAAGRIIPALAGNTAWTASHQ